MRTVLALRVVLLVTALAVIVVLSLFDWPGPLAAARCPVSATPTQTFDRRAYFAETVCPPSYHGSPVYANQTFRGYAFALEIESPDLYGLWVYLEITIAEPNGTSFHGAVPYQGGPGNATHAWFTPDNESGVAAAANSGTATLLVIE